MAGLLPNFTVEIKSSTMEQGNTGTNGFTGTGIFVGSDSANPVHKNEIDELRELKEIKSADGSNSAKITEMILHKAATRGKADHGWLVSNQSFSFADYYNPERMHFGVLRVLNDDWVAPGKGFGRHPHDNMEIISIPLDGVLEHTDSMNNTALIRKGDIQAMSAGTGIFHTEYNKSQDEPASFLQIWLFPKEKNVAPRYDQRSLNGKDRHNKFQQILSPNKEDEGVWINQDAWFHLGSFDTEISTVYNMKKPGNGVYAFVIKGDANIEGQLLNERDGLGIWNTGSTSIKTGTQGAEILLMEVPMSI
ncbi:MAG: pirin family protein, partial [Bacteroidota bacterium]